MPDRLPRQPATALFIRSALFCLAAHWGTAALAEQAPAEAPASEGEGAATPAGSGAQTETARDRSPWLATPLISSNPKFGTSIGALGGYLTHFDKTSPVSMFGVKGDYSDTNSYTLSAFANTFFDEDRQRLIAFALWGHIENDYEDFLGSGIRFETTDEIHLFFTRYLYRVTGNWFVGAQGIATNYTSSSSEPGGDDVLDYLGLSGFQSNGLGLVVTYDSRDNTRSASRGAQLVINNFAYREGLGGDDSFDVYDVEYDVFVPLLKGQVSALQVNGRWTSRAPNSAYSSVAIPGYTRGEYLAEYMTHVYWDQRIAFTERWGMSVSGALACLYGEDVFGDEQDCFERSSLYPALAAGAIFTLKPEAKLVARAEVAVGKGGNLGFILRFGQPF